MKTGKLTNQFNKNDVAEISALTEKTTPIDADPFLLEDSATSYSKKKTLWSSIKSNLLTYFYSYFSKSDGSVNPTNLLQNGDFENWSAGTAVAPDGWTLQGASATVAREATIIKINTYSAKLTRAGTNCKIYYQPAAWSLSAPFTSYMSNRTMTFGCWVYATVASRARLHIGDTIGDGYSSYHTGGSTWEWLTVTRTFGSVTGINISCDIAGGDTSAYFDGAMCVEGESAFAFADKPAGEANLSTDVFLGGSSPSNTLYPSQKAVQEYCKNFVGFYGVSWNESTDAYTRTGIVSGQTKGVTLSDYLLPIQSKMRRCVVLDNGTVNYYLGATDSTKKADMITASVLTGADGQVMVEIPKFYYQHYYIGTTHTWNISLVKLQGFEVHPAFLSGATELNYVYVGAYEAILYDFSGSSYIDYASGATITPAEDIMSSVTAKKPVTNHTRADFRQMANRRGTGWTGMLYDILSAVQLLYLVEYASFYSQSVIGAGISNVTDWAAYNNYFPIAPSGNSNSIGNASGNTAGSTSCATEASKYMSYRGIENWYGHIWKWLDGINTNDNRSYVNNVVANLADDTTTNYTNIGINNINSNGYQATLLDIARGFLPASVGADAVTKITDYYYQNTGWRVALSGGHANNGVFDGGFYLRLYDASATSSSDFGGRLCFRK